MSRVAALSLTLLALLHSPLAGQPKRIPPPPVAEREPAFTLTTDKRLAGHLEVALEQVQKKDWAVAVTLLQKVLDETEGGFALVTRKGPDGKETKILVNASAEAERILAAMPEAGRAAYEKENGKIAAEFLGTARIFGENKLLVEVGRRYLHTEAGIEAAERLAVHHFDRGDYIGSAPWFEKLLSRTQPEKLAPITLFKAAVGLSSALASKDQLDAVWNSLEARVGKDGLKVADKTLSLEELKKEVKTRSNQRAVEALDWRLFRGDASRSAPAAGGVPFLDPLWKHEIVTEGQTRDWLKQASEHLRSEKQPVLSPFHPLSIMGKKDQMPLVIYRGFWGLHARALRDLPKEDPPVKRGEVYWEAPSQWSLDRMVREPRVVGTLNSWMQSYLANRTRPSVLFENTLFGSLSTDGTHVYAVEDLQVPPASREDVDRFGRPDPVGPGGPLGEAIRHNRLQAYQEEGKLIWDVGSKGGKNEAADSFFLSAPLPLAGKLFVLNQKEHDLRLLALDPATGAVLSARKLGKLADEVPDAAHRRLLALHLAHANGILVCPTDAGAVLGVEAATGRTLWAFQYEPQEARRVPGPFGGPPGMVMREGRWVPVPQPPVSVYSAPLLARGRAVLAPPDSGALHCVSLRDGQLIWKHARREEDLYVGGIINDVVLVVGKSFCRGLKLSDGKEVWRLETGTPSGLGVATGGRYLLPLAEAKQTREPEICVIDPVQGVIFAHVRSRKKEEVPGNLCFAGDVLLSQTATTLTAYPLLENVLKEVDRRLTKDPKDPVGLSSRGDLKMDRGDVKGAVEDYRAALDNKPAAEVREQIRARHYEALVELFQRDFVVAEPFLKDFEAMSAGRDLLEAVRADRQPRFVILVARGREQQGKRLEAARLYLDLAGRGGAMLEIPGEPGLKVAPAVFARKRLESLLDAATPEERRHIEQEIIDRFKKARSRHGPEALRAFVAIIGQRSDAGRVARLELADRLTEQRDFLEAELRLLEVRRQPQDTKAAARALEQLAVLYVRRGLMPDAVAAYEELARDFGAVFLRDGKTGKDLLDELVTDKRFLPYLDGKQFVPGKQSFKVTEEQGSFPTPGNTCELERAGRELPYFRKYPLKVRLDYNQLKKIDERSGEELWSLNLEGTQVTRLTQAFTAAREPRLRCHLLGHIAVMPLGPVVFAVDPVGERLMWAEKVTSQVAFQSVTVNPADASLKIVYPGGWTQRQPLQGLVTPSVVVIHGEKSLRGIAPLTGAILWERTNLAADLDLFHDGTHLFAVELDAKGDATASHALHMEDGATVKAADFSALYRNKVRAHRGTLVLAGRDDKGKLTLRQYDPLAGKDVWSAAFPAGSLVLESDEENLAGAVQPDGAVTVFDLDAGKQLLKAKLQPDHLKEVTAVALLRDERGIYLACRKPAGATEIATSGLIAGTGTRKLPLNGVLYAFNNDGTLRWFNPAENQTLVVSQFHKLPLVVLSARQEHFIGGKERHVLLTRVFDKRTGKLLYDKQGTARANVFHSLRVDGSTGVVELIACNFKVRFEPRAGKD